MIQELEKYLERRGAKYFITLLMFCYVLGTLVFTIYLGSLGISDFEFLQLRYIFVGIIFMLISSVIFVPLVFLFRKIFKDLDLKVYEIVLALLFIAWTPFYAFWIFPMIPSNFGGSKPVLARFIGNTDKIKEINEIIEYETGAVELPLEIFPQNENLAKGANVKILDRNKDRIWIILTKDLYLGSRSKLAKDLIEAGESFADISEDEFITKPLLVDAEGIKNISFSLYEPPEEITKADIEIIKANPNLSEVSTEVVTQFITKAAPEKAKEILEVIETNDQEAIAEVIENPIDEAFIEFRQQFFEKITSLTDLERSNGIDDSKRWNFVLTFVESIQSISPDLNLSLATLPYLSAGIEDHDYTKKIAKAIQGAPDMPTIITRLEALEPLPPVIPEIEAPVSPEEETETPDEEAAGLETGSGSTVE